LLKKVTSPSIYRYSQVIIVDADPATAKPAKDLTILRLSIASFASSIPITLFQAFVPSATSTRVSMSFLSRLKRCSDA
jgi:hypothetical protein